MKLVWAVFGLLLAQGVAAGSLLSSALDAVGEFNLPGPFIIGRDPVCLADPAVTDKTKCRRSVTVIGKQYIYLRGGLCIILDPNKAAVEDLQKVSPNGAALTRPAYRIDKYLQCPTCALVKVTNVDVGTICTGDIIKPANYRKVGTFSGVDTMSICGLVPGQQVLQPTAGWVGIGNYSDRFGPWAMDSVCDAKLAGQSSMPPVGPGAVFCLTSDDKAELFIDDKSILASGPNLQVCSSPVVLTTGLHQVRVTFIEFTFGARLQLLSNNIPLASSWTASYFANTTFSGAPVLVRPETVLDFNWGAGSPASSVPADNWSAVFTGTLTAP